MKSRGKREATGRALARTLFLLLFVSLLACSAHVYAQVPAHSPASPERVVARVNGVSITDNQLSDEMEVLYPSNTAHGGLQPGNLKEIRAKALEELIVQELAYQQAVKSRALVPMAEVRAEYGRIRTKYGAQAFDRSLQSSGLSTRQYMKNLQRRMTLARLFKQKVYAPARVGPQALRSYYQQNLQKFQRPAQVHARLILAAVNAKAGPAGERAAQEKIQKVYEELRAGKDFGQLAEQYSDDFYKVKGGNLGWVHRGRFEPEFEKVAFSLPVGKSSEPFRTSYGYNLMKVEAREPAQQMKFEEVRATLKAELERKKMIELRQRWVEQLKKSAQIEVLDEAPVPRAAH